MRRQLVEQENKVLVRAQLLLSCQMPIVFLLCSHLVVHILFILITFIFMLLSSLLPHNEGLKEIAFVQKRRRVLVKGAEYIFKAFKEPMGSENAHMHGARTALISKLTVITARLKHTLYTPSRSLISARTMVGTRSGWNSNAGFAPAVGQIYEPNLTETAAQQSAFYEAQFRTYGTTALTRPPSIGLRDFKRPNRLARWGALGPVSERLSERAFFKVTQLVIEVYTNLPDQPTIDAAVAPPLPPLFLPPLFNGMGDFSRTLQSRQTQRFTEASCNSYVAETSLLRMAKTSGELNYKSKIEREQRWLETRGPIFREVLFKGEYYFPTPFPSSPVGRLCTRPCMYLTFFTT